MFSDRIPTTDFLNRITYCQKEAAARGLSGLMVWSRGGGTFDRYADVDFLANFYQQRCYLADNPPLWSGRSHCVLLIPVSGDPVLLVSSPEYQRELIAVEDIRFSANLPILCSEVLQELGMEDQPIGLIGGDVLTYSMSSQLTAVLPRMTVVPADSILSSMRKVKTAREQESIREACRIGSTAMEMVMKNVSVNKTESEVIAPAIEYIISQGAVLYFVVTNSGTEAHAAHSADFPGYDRHHKLQKGELFKIDLIIAFEGYLCDFGRTTVVGDTANETQAHLIETVTAACDHVISLIKPGMKVSELCKLGDEFLAARQISLSAEQTDPEITYAAYPPHWGHGLGMTWELPYFTADEDTVIEPGMYLAIEKALYKQDTGTVFYEQNVLVTESGTELLTTTRKHWYSENTDDCLA